MSDSRRQFGDRGERIAEDHLCRNGYTIVARNYRCRVGEIDLIALDGDTIVFVEVKSRGSEEVGNPLEAVTPHKQRQIARAALYYLRGQRLLDHFARFDVIALLFDGDEVSIDLVKNAFEVPGR